MYERHINKTTDGEENYKNKQVSLKSYRVLSSYLKDTTSLPDQVFSQSDVSLSLHLTK